MKCVTYHRLAAAELIESASFHDRRRLGLKIGLVLDCLPFIALRCFCDV